MTFSPESLFATLRSQPQPAAYVVAYSGGLDSHLLLDALVQLRARHGLPVSAVHVNHGLQPAADDWQTHCAGVCHALCVSLAMLRVDARPASGESPEAAARAARYRALADWLPAAHCLLLAQHQDDQAETVLLQLLRGAGMHGLAAMALTQGFGRGSLLRPLLAYPRAELERHARTRGLHWVEDPSNADPAYTRNFLRHRILVPLRERWPRVTASLARSALNQAEGAQLLDELGAADLSLLEAEPGVLQLTALRHLSGARQRNALRHWLRAATGSVPSRAVFERIMQDLLDPRIDAEPCVRWGNFELRRYRERIYLLARQAVPPAAVLPWTLAAPLALPDGAVLEAVATQGEGLRRDCLDAGVEVRWRRGGERCRPERRGHSHELRKLFQEWGVPPWERNRIPLIYIDGELAAVAGRLVCEPFVARAGQAGVRLCWRRPHTLTPAN